MKRILSMLCALTLITGSALVSSGASAQQDQDAVDAELSSIFGDSPELLPPEEAFRGELALINGALQLRYQIEEGYYLYRDKFSIVSSDGSVVLDEPQWPEAGIIEDDYFGKSAIYRTDMTARIPVQSASSSIALIDVTYQGCADIGVCFPPTTQTFSVSGLPAAAPRSVLEELRALSGSSDASSSAAGGFSGDLSSGGLSFRTNEQELLSPGEAYRPFVETTPNGVNVVWDIEDGYYLYKDKLTYSITTADDEELSIVQTVRAAGEVHEDEFFGKSDIYRHQTVDQLILANGSSGKGTITLFYQGCADIGVCFPPEQFTIPLSWKVAGTALPGAADVGGSDAGGAGGSNAGVSALGLSEQDRLASQLATSSLWFNAAAFFVFGILLAFTPCVLPMIPILSSLILGGGKDQSTAQSFRLSVTYVLGMALTYTLVGVLVGLSGYNIQAWFQNPLILSGFAALFVLLSLAMFGVYELQVPAALQTRLTSISNKQSGGRSGGVFVMGILSALIVGPCVTAPLMGALIYIADTGNAVVGGTALFALSIGMGMPLILIGASAGKWVPKAGGWMSAVKIVFGFLMLAMAIWMLSRFLPGSTVVLLSAVLAVCAGVWSVLEYSKTANGMALRTIGTAAGLMTALYGLALLLGALSGTPSLLRPLGGLTLAGGANGASSMAESKHLNFERIKSLEDLNQQVALAQSRGQAVMLDFYADWCVSCKEMEAFTFTHPAIQDQLANVVLIQADVTANDKTDQALLKHFGLFGPPAIIFYGANGDEIRNARLVGFLDADEFGNHLQLVLPDDDTQSAAL